MEVGTPKFGFSQKDPGFVRSSKFEQKIFSLEKVMANQNLDLRLYTLAREITLKGELTL